MGLLRLRWGWSRCFDRSTRLNFSSCCENRFIDRARVVFAMVGVLDAIETLIGNLNQAMGLIAVLRRGGNAVVNADADQKFEWPKRFVKNQTNTTAESGSLRGI